MDYIYSEKVEQPGLAFEDPSIPFSGAVLDFHPGFYKNGLQPRNRGSLEEDKIWDLSAPCFSMFLARSVPSWKITGLGAYCYSYHIGSESHGTTCGS